MLPKREGMHSGPFVLRVFNLSLAGGNLREDLRGRFQQNIHQFSRCAFSELWSLLIGQCQGRWWLVTAAGPGVAHLALLVFWAWT